MSTNSLITYRRAPGFALVVALILLLVLTILGIATMNNTVMQERMAGNVNLQTLAFEAASAGIVDSLIFLESGLSCRRGKDDEGLFPDRPFSELTELSEALPLGTRAGFTLRAGCFEPPDPPLEWADWEEGIPLQLLVLSTGIVCRGATCDGTNADDVLSSRDVEVRISPLGGEPECLFNIGPLEPDSFGQNARSGAYNVDAGDGGCPIRFADSDDASDFERLLAGPNEKASRVGQWEPNPPGITSSAPRGIFDDAERMARSVNAVKIGVRAYQEFGANENPFGACAGALYLPGESVGSIPPDPPLLDPAPHIIYIADDYETAGQSVGTLSDAVLIIEGKFTINGGTSLDNADVLMLGGHFDISGWGNSVNSSLMYLENLQIRDTASPVRVAYDPIAESTKLAPSTYFNISGMGSATVGALDCDKTKARWANLNSCIDSLKDMVNSDVSCPAVGGVLTKYECAIADIIDRNGGSLLDYDVPELEGDNAGFDIPACSGPDGGGLRNVIASWREYIDRSRW